MANGTARKTKSMKGLALMRNLVLFSVVTMEYSRQCLVHLFIIHDGITVNHLDGSVVESDGCGCGVLLAALTMSRNLGRFLSFSPTRLVDQVPSFPPIFFSP